MTDKPRPLRILHIGNVANYAYNIGKVLQTEDIVSHAISWDYYHINAQPVWEEGVFDASAVGDQFFPRLPNAKQAGFNTPDWYVQGPRVLACLTLIARNEGLHDRAMLFQKALDKHLEQINDPAYMAKMAGGQQRLMELAYTDLLGGFDKAKRSSPVRRSVIRMLAASGMGHRVNQVRWAVLNRVNATKWAILGRTAGPRMRLRNRMSAAKWAFLGRTAGPRIRLRNRMNAAKWAFLGRTAGPRMRFRHQMSVAKWAFLGRTAGPRMRFRHQMSTAKWAFLGRTAAMRIRMRNRMSAAKWAFLGRTAGMRIRMRNQANASKWAILGRAASMRVSMRNQANASKWALLGGIAGLRVRMLNQTNAAKWAILGPLAGLRIRMLNMANAAKWTVLAPFANVRVRLSNQANAAKWAVLGPVANARVRLRNQANAAKWMLLNQLDAMRSLAARGGAKFPEPIKLKIKGLLGWGRQTPPQQLPAEVPQVTGAAEALAPAGAPVNGKVVDSPRELPMSAPNAAENRGADIATPAAPLASPAAPAEKVAPVEAAPPAATAAPPEAADRAEAVAAELSPFEAHVQALIAQYQAIYPDREFDPMLLRQYEHTLPLMRRLFSHYDVIIGYAIEGIWPLMAGVPYVAYEFGTIRNLPFQDTPTGRLAALTYRNCQQTIVTNSDNEAPAKRLGRPYFFLPHVVNESGLLNAEEAAAARAEFIAEHGGDFIVFHPPRQHWDEQRDTSWDKGNDHLFRGFAKLVKKHAPNARCIAVSWGDTLKRSQELIAELGITDNVVWITPQPHIAMMRYIGICDVLCDQFTIPTFGGIPPKAFHAGKPVVTSFDPELHRWCFDELPPLIAANSADKAYKALAHLYTDKAFAAELGRKGADWYRRENSNARVREVLLAHLTGLDGRGEIPGTSGRQDAV